MKQTDSKNIPFTEEIQYVNQSECFYATRQHKKVSGTCFECMEIKKDIIEALIFKENVVRESDESVRHAQNRSGLMNCLTCKTINTEVPWEIKTVKRNKKKSFYPESNQCFSFMILEYIRLS